MLGNKSLINLRISQTLGWAILFVGLATSSTGLAQDAMQRDQAFRDSLMPKPASEGRPNWLGQPDHGRHQDGALKEAIEAAVRAARRHPRRHRTPQST